MRLLNKITEHLKNTAPENYVEWSVYLEALWDESNKFKKLVDIIRSAEFDVCPFVKRRSGAYWKCTLVDDYCTIPEHYHACTRYEKEVSE